MFNVLLNYQVTNDWYLSASYHYKSAYNPSIKGSDAKLGKSFSRLDLKTAKRWVTGNNWIELSFVAQNLGDDYADHYFYNIFESKYILGIKVGSN
jgi:hypothetical protein